MRRLVLIGLALLIAGCSPAFREGLNEKQADDVVVMLQLQGIKASKTHAKDGTWSVEVESSGESTAEQVMQAYDRPRQPHPTLGDVFPGGSLLPSETEERIRYEYALSEQLSDTLERIDGVLTARVHVAIPEQDPRRTEPVPPSAAAMIRYRSDQRMDLLRPQIKRLIADSLTGGSPDNVDLLMVPVYPIVQDEAIQEVKTYAGLRYRASEWARVVFLTGLPWLVAFLLLVLMIKAMGRSENRLIAELWKNMRQRIMQRRGGGSPMSGGSGPSYGPKGMAGLAKRPPKPPAGS
ncbi:MAG TPA: type III secretion inner membrane ring lipoprotein SctJ [Dyella sp.]|uniref:type III secretion system inner membrane ring lipoprotein SctJ n=1 Tax=Dyella sp. TaxID=1869338 RepID=UPI002CEC9E56|nr:type III secretion inner membrane ring lipoprotein SctJ [Dyella sp.]HTV87274.1 type III secretion inner membrane ring lipoprotein SctJ [Dyella sp.]